MGTDLKAFQHDVRALHDEVRLKLPAARLEVRDEWKLLERLLDFAVNGHAPASGDLVQDLRRRVSAFKVRLG